jgi:NTP pyrophosphatase (non-canonical NTP hydrolase)
MEAVLKANDHKGGWDGCDSTYLLKRLKEEVIELEVQINHNTREPIDLTRIIHEAVDVANYAMMIADNLRDQCTKQ